MGNRQGQVHKIVVLSQIGVFLKKPVLHFADLALALGIADLAELGITGMGSHIGHSTAAMELPEEGMSPTAPDILDEFVNDIGRFAVQI